MNFIGPSILLLFFFVLAFSAFYMISNWCISDAMRRGKSPILVFIAVILFFPWGLIAWLLFRPNIVEEGRKAFRLEDFREQ